MRLIDADRPPALAAVQALLHEYAALPHIAGRWADPAADIAALPGDLAPPAGVLLLALDGETPLGCVGLRRFDADGACEMKRLYVRPAARGRGVGEALVRALLDRARTLGYRRMVLDTAPDLAAARELYERLGFTPIPSYRADVAVDVVCYARPLEAAPR